MAKEIEKITFYSTKEVAQRLGISPRSIQRYIKNGKLKATRLGHMSYVSRPVLLEFLNISSQAVTLESYGEKFSEPDIAG